SFYVNSLNELTNSGFLMSYDSNGNLTNFGGYNIYTYDDENRLTQLSDSVYHSFQSGFLYDGLGRLRERIDYSWQSKGIWRPTNTVLYVYDGWRVIQERDSNSVPTVSYTRGNDLSGTMEGAGGIGGLLARSSGYSGGNWTSHAYYFADGNGNITYMLDSSQTMAASYRYSPFGSTISSSGSLATANIYRFSSKEIHVNSGMYYYGYRFYAPDLQRWINRDPINELGFKTLNAGDEGIHLDEELNLYAFVNNRPIDGTDPKGTSCDYLCIRFKSLCPLYVCVLQSSDCPPGRS